MSTQIRAPDQILDRIYVISMELLSLRHRSLYLQNVLSGEKGGEMARLQQDNRDYRPL